MPIDDAPPLKSGGKGGGEGALWSALRPVGADVGADVGANVGGVLVCALPLVQLDDESDFLRPENTEGVRIFRDSGGVVARKDGAAGGCACG